MRANTPYIIDVEASGFGSDSYPIEVGIALENNCHYCSLIQPHQSWTHWDDSAQDVHGITRNTLRKEGLSIYNVAKELNSYLDGKVIYSDGWVVDEPWVIKLFSYAKLPRKFRMYDIQTIMSEAQMEAWGEVKQQVMSDLKLFRHSAINDAQIIQETFVRTRDLNNPPYKKYGTYSN